MHSEAAQMIRDNETELVDHIPGGIDPVLQDLESV